MEGLPIPMLLSSPLSYEETKTPAGCSLPAFPKVTELVSGLPQMEPNFVLPIVALPGTVLYFEWSFKSASS